MLGDADYFSDILYVELCFTLRNQIVPRFWAHFELESNVLPTSNKLLHKLFQKFVLAVSELESDYNACIEALKRKITNIHCDILHNNLTKYIKSKEALRISLMAQLPLSFHNVVYAFYSVSMKVFDRFDNSLDLQNKNICYGCNLEIHACLCSHLIRLVNETNERLLRMDLLDCIAGQTLTSLVEKRLKEKISTTCYDAFYTGHLKNLKMWLDETIIRWLTQLFDYKTAQLDKNNFNAKRLLSGFDVKLTFFLYEYFAHSIIDQFFGIIIDFPESIPAINDLKLCMEKIKLEKKFMATLKKALKIRILHPGVNTMNILTGYVAAIKAIRYLEKMGATLLTVTAPIKEYLRKRSDTVRRVVTALTDEGPTDLSEELLRGERHQKSISSSMSDQIGVWDNWLPPPFQLKPTPYYFSENVSRSADILSMVVDIYGSKELFMNEYRNLMADRLLKQLNFVTEKELRNLELLKLRFGESLLHSCEVMLKDVSDSKRINSHIQSDVKYTNSKTIDISSLIISSQFWPCFNKEYLELPEEIANEFRKYTESYEAYKGNRTLTWRYVTGCVNILVEIGQRHFEMTVSPTQAVIIYHFQHKDEWEIEELSSVMKLSPSLLRRRICFWQSHGLICEISPGIFKLNEKDLGNSLFKEIQNTQLITNEEDVESEMASASDQREEELQVFWSYIVGMLTNLDSLPLERIHQMLKLFASHGLGVKFSKEDLRNFLQRMVHEHKLLFSGGAYQLSK